ncbi:unnamed protein product [Merluccius merluccius]
MRNEELKSLSKCSDWTTAAADTGGETGRGTPAGSALLADTSMAAAAAAAAARHPHPIPELPSQAAMMPLSCGECRPRNSCALGE